MSVTPAASIVMPLRVQRDDWLEQSVRSALEQTAPTEVIVVTAHETPPSNLAVLDRLADGGGLLRVVVRPRRGFAVALNTGIAEVRTERFGILHSDDWLDRRTIAASLNVDADVVSAGKQVLLERSDGWTEVTFEWTGTKRVFNRMLTLEEKARYVTHFLFMRREIVLRVGGVDETLGDLSGVDDFDMVWSLLEAGASVGFTRRAHYRLRDHPGDRLTLRSAADQVKSLERILEKHQVPIENRAAIVADHSRWYGRTVSDGLVDRERG